MQEQNNQNVVAKLKHTGAVTAPSLFTLGNLACGFFSILAATRGHYEQAGWLILFASVFDMFDGRVARLLSAESEFGIEMDSLADTISFCAAPAFLMYFFVLKENPLWGGVIACIYTCFGVLRLAKFNTMAKEGTSSKKYFSGLPVPTPAAIIASFAISYQIMVAGGHNLPFLTYFLPHLHNYYCAWFMMLLFSLLMVSTVPYAAFKSPKQKMSVWFLLLFVFLVILLVKFPQDTVLVVFLLYVIAGLLAALYRKLRGIKVEK